MNIPGDRRYSSDHEWIIWKGNSAQVGITDYAQDALGDVVFVQLPKVGEKFAVGASCCEVESTKSVSDIYTPLAGTISGVNVLLIDAPSLLNTDPYGQGWIFEMQIEDGAAIDKLLDSASYRQLIEG